MASHFGYATHRKDLSAAFVFYGTPPPDVTAITAPVYGFYAGNDARVTATVPAATEAMKVAGKKYDPVTYEGAGHGFMRAGQDPAANDANKKAWTDSFTRMTGIITKINAGGTALRTPPNSTRSASLKTVAAKTKAKPTAVNCHEETPAGKTTPMPTAMSDMNMAGM